MQTSDADKFFRTEADLARTEVRVSAAVIMGRLTRVW
jgi:hypothetical protein